MEPIKFTEIQEQYFTDQAQQIHIDAVDFSGKISFKKRRGLKKLLADVHFNLQDYYSISELFMLIYSWYADSGGEGERTLTFEQEDKPFKDILAIKTGSGYLVGTTRASKQVFFKKSYLDHLVVGDCTKREYGHRSLLPTSIRMYEDQLNATTIMAVNRGIKPSEVVRECIDIGIEELKNKRK